jgi:hypothetical protein
VDFETWACFFTGFIILDVLYKYAAFWGSFSAEFNGINVWQSIVETACNFASFCYRNRSKLRNKNGTLNNRARNNLSSSNSFRLSRLSSPQLEDEKGFRNVIRRKFIIFLHIKRGKRIFFSSETQYFKFSVQLRDVNKLWINEVYKIELILSSWSFDMN